VARAKTISALVFDCACDSAWPHLAAFDYETRPMIGDAPADIAEARADLPPCRGRKRWCRLAGYRI